MFHLHGLTNLFLSSADNWIVIARHHCVCVLVELRSKRLEKGLDQPHWMPIVKVNLVKTETSWSTQVAIAGWKKAIYLDISAVPPSEAPDNFLMHFRDSPAGPDEFARDHIHRTIPKAVSGSALIPPDELQVCRCWECDALQSAIWQSTPLLCSLMRLRT